MELISAVGELLSLSWRFFTQINVPGFEFSFAVLFIGLFLATFGLRLLFMVLDMGSASDGGSYGSSKGGKVKVSKERQNDER